MGELYYMNISVKLSKISAANKIFLVIQIFPQENGNFGMGEGQAIVVSPILM